MARIVSWATAGVDPAIMGTGPIPATPQGAGKGRMVGQGPRACRSQRSLRRPGARGQQGPRLGSGDRQRQRRRDRARPSDRRFGRAGADDAPARNGAPQREKGPCDAMHRRRHGHRDGGRTVNRIGSQTKAERAPVQRAARVTKNPWGGNMARVAVVTGGTRGIGAAVSKALKAAGCEVAATYHSNDEAAAQIQGRDRRSRLQVERRRTTTNAWPGLPRSPKISDRSTFWSTTRASPRTGCSTR